MRILIDTNVIIDFLQRRQPFAQDAKKLFDALANQLIEGYITASSVTDIYFLSRRFSHSDLKSREMIRSLLKIVSVLDTRFEDILKALNSTISDFEDGVIVETALRCQIDCIVTRNEKDFTNSEITVYTPTSFLKFLENENQ